MSLPYRLSAALFGTAAMITLVHSQPAVAALNTTQIAEIARQVTVQIVGQAPGSGVIIAREGQIYYVLTAAHVVQTEDEYEIIAPDGKKYPLDYKQVKKFPGMDLAVVSFTSTQNYRVVEIGNSDQVQEGDPTYVSGFPMLGTETTQTQYRFSPGELIAQASRPLANGYGLAYANDTFVGMSGGSILNQQGQLIGIHGSSKTPFDKSQGVAPRLGIKFGLNLGVPINLFLSSATQVIPTLKFPIHPPKSTPSQLTAADLLIQAVERGVAGKQQDALTILTQTIRLQPNYAAAYLMRADFRSDEDKQGKLKDYSEAIRLSPNLILAHVSRGLVRMAMGDKQGAFADTTQAIRLNPNLAIAYNNRGFIRNFMGDKQGALADLNKAIQLNPTLALAYVNRGGIRLELGNKQGALADFDEAIRLDSNIAFAYLNRGAMRINSEDKQGALADTNQAIRLDPTLALAYVNRGRIRLELGNKQEALADFDEAIRLDSNLAFAYVNRGAIRTTSGDKQGALADFNEAIRLDPTLAIAYSNRGFIRVSSGDQQGAMKDFNEAIRLDPNLALAYLNRGRIRGASDKQGAIADFQRAAELFRSQGNIQVYQQIMNVLRKLQN